LFAEIEALQSRDQDQGVPAFERAFDGHVAFTLSNIFGSLFHNLTLGAFASAPPNAGATRYWWKQLARASRSFALVADATVALLGGGLKVKQKITGRMADALAELYLLSCILKRYEDDGSPRADLKLVDYCAENCLCRFDKALAGTLDNFPLRWVGLLMRPLVFPYGFSRNPASDRDGKAIARAALQPGEHRDRLTRDIYITDDPNDRMGLLEHTLNKVIAAEEADKKLERAIRKGDVRRFYNNDWIADAEARGVITAEEAKSLAELRDLTARVIAVDDFDAAELARRQQPARNADIHSFTPPKDSIAAE
jgi:acyl-CoA dehydrogenase